MAQYVCSILFFISALLLEYKNSKDEALCKKERPIVMTRLCLGFGYSIVAACLPFIYEGIRNPFERLLPIETYSIHYPYNKFYMHADYHNLLASTIAVPIVLINVVILFFFYKKKIINPLNGLGVLFALYIIIYPALATTPYFLEKNVKEHSPKLDGFTAVSGCPSRFD